MYKNKALSDMCALQDIQKAHAQVQTGADFPKYIATPKAMGIEQYETFVTDGHTAYVGTDTYLAW